MSYAGLAYGHNAGSYGAQPATNPGSDEFYNSVAALRRDQQSDFAREMHERSLQMQEQQRRMYDSQTARQAQDKKFSVLDGLTRRAFGGGGGFSIDGRGNRTNF